MGEVQPPIVTVDANVLFQSFPRYLFLRLNERGICKVAYSNLIRDEFTGNLLEKVRGMTMDKVASIRGHIAFANVEEQDLDNPEHKDKMDLLSHVNEKDKHVLYLAYISKSDFLVTEDIDFQDEVNNNENNTHLEFYFPVKAVSFDSCIYAMIGKENFDEFVKAVIGTLTYMWGYEPQTIFNEIEELYPNIHFMLFPRFEEIAAAVEAGRQAL